MRFARQVDGADGGERAIRVHHDAFRQRRTQRRRRHQLFHRIHPRHRVARCNRDCAADLDLVCTVAAGDTIHHSTRAAGGDEFRRAGIGKDVVARAAVEGVNPGTAGESVGT